ncbi:hypothetical protein E4O93_11600 [Diaphorobacter sp. DS2]|nr:hypothetical protein E4O93_11600 [Diaphorobacter sp. DS2]
MARSTNAQKKPQDMRHLMRELAPFLRPYRIHLAGAMAFLLLAALATLAFPTALRQLIDGVRIPRDGGHDSMLMADSVPA